MYVDRLLAESSRARTARDHGVGIVLDAWSGVPPDRPAAEIAALGDVARAASRAGGGWSKLLAGEIPQALEIARGTPGAPGMGLLEAECLIAAGALVAGLERLENLHRRGITEGTIGLVRRRHQLGEHLGAMRAAQTMPWHAHVALTGARSAIAAGQPGIALRLVEPYLQGFAPLPEPAVAAALVVTAASILADFGEDEQLRQFVEAILHAGDLQEDMLPGIARAAWIAGLARDAWRLLEGDASPWRIAARLELAVLAGDAGRAAQLLQQAGPLGAPSQAAVDLLQGVPDTTGRPAGDTLTESAGEVFAAGRMVHVWRTHPHRWQPWIEAALRTPAEVVVCDLAAGALPAPDALPSAVMDDGALVRELAPVRVPCITGGAGVAISEDLCTGVGVGHDWPAAGTDALRGALPAASGEPAVRIVGADEALAGAADGRRAVVIAPPGDPFWAGSLPERVWPAMRVVRASPHAGWQDAPARAAAAARDLLGAPHAPPSG